MPFFLVWNREWRIPHPSVAALEIAKRFMNKGALIEKEQVLEKDRRHRVLLYIGQRQLAVQTCFPFVFVDFHTNFFYNEERLCQRSTFDARILY